MTELIVRFFVGGCFVSLFAALGSAFNPKTFAGLFAASPAVAVVGLATAFHEYGELQVEALAAAMLLGAVALLLYCAVCAFWVRIEHAPVALGALVALCVWGLAAAGLFGLARE